MIHLQNVRKHYGQLQAVNDISFVIPAKSVFSIVGPSGCGKSTLLRVLAGIEKPDEGSVKLDTIELPSGHGDIVMVWQKLALFPHLNVRENVEFGLRVRGRDSASRSKIVHNLLTSVELAGFESRRINRLSGGEMKRVALARALAVNPRVLLLDEPFSGLDLKLRDDIMSLIRKIHGETGLTVVLVTHDHVEAISMSSHMVVMNNGAMEQWGELDDVLSQPRTGFVARFVGKRNVFDGKVTAIENGRVRVVTGSKCFWGVVPTWLDPCLCYIGADVHYIVDRRNIKMFGMNENNMQGEVSQIVYDGSILSIRIGKDPRCMCTVDFIAGGKSMKVGDAAALTWSAADAYVIPKRISK